MKRLFKLAVIGGLVYGGVRFFQAQKAEWEGLTESEVRDKIDTKLAGRVPDEAADQIKDGVVQKMQSMGKLAEDEAAVAEEAEASGDDAPAEDEESAETTAE